MHALLAFSLLLSAAPIAAAFSLASHRSISNSCFSQWQLLRSEAGRSGHADRGRGHGFRWCSNSRTGHRPGRRRGGAVAAARQARGYGGNLVFRRFLRASWERMGRGERHAHRSGHLLSTGHQGFGRRECPFGQDHMEDAGLADVGGGSVPAQIQVRANPKDPNGFFWVPGELLLLEEDRISLSVVFSASQRARGTFHKHKVGEGGA